MALEQSLTTNNRLVDCGRNGISSNGDPVLRLFRGGNLVAKSFGMGIMNWKLRTDENLQYYMYISLAISYIARSRPPDVLKVEEQW